MCVCVCRKSESLCRRQRMKESAAVRPLSNCEQNGTKSGGLSKKEARSADGFGETGHSLIGCQAKSSRRPISIN